MRRSVPCAFYIFPVVVASMCLGACGGGDDSLSAPLPSLTAPAARTLGDGRLSELVEWARASQGVPAMALVGACHRARWADR